MRFKDILYFEKWPNELNNLRAQDIYDVYQKPILVHLNKSEKPAIFVSTLLHGNEHSGFEAFKRFFGNQVQYAQNTIIFIANTYAAKYNSRLTEGGVDYNRIWSEDVKNTPRFVTEIKDYIHSNNVELIVDIHNNTGRNPLYSCISKLESEHLKIASLFGEKTIYFTEPHEALSVTYSKTRPSVTLEAGISLNPAGLEALQSFLEDILIKGTRPHHIQDQNTIFHTIGTVKIPKGSEIRFDDQEADFNFPPELDALNFHYVTAGTKLGRAKKMPIVLSNDNENIAGQFFKIVDENLILIRDVVPAMLTKDIAVIHADNLCYFMEEISL